MTHIIKRVAVIGAGTMGGGIAAHFANAGFQVDLLDIAPDKLTPEEEKRGLKLESPAVRNRIVTSGWERVKSARPAALFAPEVAERVRLGNTVDHFDRLQDADWIIEVIIEKLEPKQDLMARIEKIRKPQTIVSTNTSGIPIHSIAEGRSAEFKAHFLGTHFFNPPRYMKLLEVIPTPDTDPEALAFVKDFATRVLGKGVVVCKDTPNFIANRLGSFDGMFGLRYTLDHGYSVEEVDYLTGPIIGNPKTASYRLLDLVGLDIFIHVARNLYDAVPDDESRDILTVPAPIATMLEKQMLGNKTKGGFYKEMKQEGERQFWPLNLQTLEYQPPQKVKFAEIDAVRKVEDPAQRLRGVISQPEERGSGYLWNLLANSVAYASRRLPEISDDIPSVDNAMKWGYGRQYGPFETWDLMGVPDTVARMTQCGIKVADWVVEMLEGGYTSFYTEENGQRQVYDLKTKTYAPVPTDPLAISLDGLRATGKEIKRNESASLIDLGDGVMCLEFHSRGNSIDNEIGQLLSDALDMIETSDEWQGLVIGNQGENFCLGANIGFVAFNAMAQQWDVLENMINGFQQTLQRVRFFPKPVVAAPHGMALGGGCEVCMAAARIAASAETYIGLVEVGVGLIPGGGGCKEMLRRVVSPAMKTPNVDPLPFVSRVVTQIGMAKVATSAFEARQMGILDEDDMIVMHPDRVLGEAKQLVLDLAPNYLPPAREKTVYAVGKPVLAAVKMNIWALLQSATISEHDAKITRELAHALCGGELSTGQWVDEQYILDLERKAFLNLLHEPKTLERIAHTLQTGKPLRN